jgi:hypothetical protein
MLTRFAVAGFDRAIKPKDLYLEWNKVWVS